MLAVARSGVLTLLRQTGFNLSVFVANAFDEGVLPSAGCTLCGAGRSMGQRDAVLLPGAGGGG